MMLFEAAIIMHVLVLVFISETIKGVLQCLHRERKKNEGKGKDPLQEQS